MNFFGFIAVGVGAAFGALLRWALGYLLNPIFPTLPPGTLAANLIGGYLIGIAIAFFTEHGGIPPEARLFVITGFMGGLTTFSTFSAEAVTMLSRAEYPWALAHIAAHLAGSLGMTALGLLTVNLLRSGGGV